MPNQTGPRTPEGKARSASNATTHGFTAQRLVVPEHLQEEFHRFQASFVAQTDPQGVLEAIVVDRAIHAAWNLERLEEMENALMASSDDPLADEETAKKLDRLSRYHARHERTYNRAMNELRRLQTDRFLRPTLPDDIADTVPATVGVQQVHSAKRNERRARPEPAIALQPLMQQLEHEIKQDQEREKLLNKLVKEVSSG